MRTLRKAERSGVVSELSTSMSIPSKPYLGRGRGRVRVTVRVRVRVRVRAKVRGRVKVGEG